MKMVSYKLKDKNPTIPDICVSQTTGEHNNKNKFKKKNK